MKVALLTILALTLALTLATASYAQANAPTKTPVQAPQSAQVEPEDEDAPQLTLDEKLALVKLDLQKQAALDAARKALTAKVKPIQDAEDALKLILEKKYEGYTLTVDANGYRLVKPKPEKK